jgi:hypothetical protein
MTDDEDEIRTIMNDIERVFAGRDRALCYYAAAAVLGRDEAACAGSDIERRLSLFGRVARLEHRNAVEGNAPLMATENVH